MFKKKNEGFQKVLMKISTEKIIWKKKTREKCPDQVFSGNSRLNKMEQSPLLQDLSEPFMY